MNLPLLLLLFSFASQDTISNDDKFEQHISSAYHYHSNVMIRNYDGTSSSIYKSGSTITIFNSDGTQMSITYNGNKFSTIIAMDGKSRTVHHSGFSSTINNHYDATQIFVNHTGVTSTCTLPDATHTINHTFGFSKEWRKKSSVDVLIHMNWLMKKKMNEAIAAEEKELKKKQYLETELQH